ncbi:hypothetical protein [Microbacterium sp. cf046]|uniref:hypothetical protein n=1 Tax=Microbacterium sp. cf046 TaxID=1761803 RepID=UPI0011135F1F|nr:hypothetical protein [Microbacterium sp. cf046]
MADPQYRRLAESRLDELQILPVNDLATRLQRGRQPDEWPPYVSAEHDLEKARIITLIPRPEPRPRLKVGSGMFSFEDDHPSAERMSQVFDAVGLEARHVMPWHAYPWRDAGRHTHEQLDAGAKPLIELIGLLPRVRAIVAHGEESMYVAGRLYSPDVARTLLRDRGIHVFAARSTSPSAWSLDEAATASALRTMREVYRIAMVQARLKPREEERRSRRR